MALEVAADADRRLLASSADQPGGTAVDQIGQRDGTGTITHNTDVFRGLSPGVTLMIGDPVRIRVLLTISAIAAVGMFTPAAARAEGPAAVRCGSVVSTDAYLATDLTCPDGNGVTLAGNLTLDLRGHQLRGPGATEAAVIVRSGFSARIQNGAIKAWGVGVGRANPDPDSAMTGTATVRNVRFLNNVTAVAPQGSDIGGTPTAAFVVRNSLFENNTFGIGVIFTGSVTVNASSFRGNSDAVRIDTGKLEVTGSRFYANMTGVSCVEGNCTIRSSYLFGNQTALTSGTYAIAATGNVLTRNGIGLITVGSSGNALSSNVFAGNTTAVHFLGAGGTVTRNTFTANGVGFTSEDGGDPMATTLDRNIFIRNGSGIFIEDQGVSLKSNIAVRNTDWGIYAPQSIDLGGNQASGNGNSPQCVGVVC